MNDYVGVTWKRYTIDFTSVGISISLAYLTPSISTVRLRSFVALTGLDSISTV